MWNLLSVLQIIVFLSGFTNWPALVKLVLVYLKNAIYLEDITKAVFEYGKTRFEIAKEKNVDNAFILEQGLEAKSIMRNFGIVLLFFVGIFVLFGIYYLLKFCSKKFSCFRIVTNYLSS